MAHTKDTVKARLKELGVGSVSQMLMHVSTGIIARELREDESIQVFMNVAEVDGKKGVLFATEKRVVFLSLTRNEELLFSKISSVNYNTGLSGYVEFAASGNNMKVKTPGGRLIADYVRKQIA